MGMLVQRLVEISITAGIAVLGVCLVRLFCKKAPRWIAVLLWGLVGLRLLLPFSIESPVSVVPSVNLSQTEQSVSTQAEQTPSKVVTESADHEDVHDAPTVGTTAAALPTAVRPTVPFWQIASIVWAVGAAGMLVYAVLSYYAVWRRVRAATKETEGVYRAEAVGSPFILGVLRPRIYVPYSLHGESLEAVLLHERAHIKRLDHVIKPLGFLLLGVYWFQPLLWLGYILLCRDIELACDERVVRSLSQEQRRRYSATLVASAVGRRRIAACPLAFGEVAVKERVKNVMNYKKPAFWVVLAAVLLSAVATACLLTNRPTASSSATFEGATLKAYVGYREADGISLSEQEETPALSLNSAQNGTFGFALKDTDTDRMTVTLACNREVYVGGEAVREIIVPYNEELKVYPQKDDPDSFFRFCIKPPSAMQEDDWCYEEELTEMTLRRYVSGNTVLYLYHNHFWLTTGWSSVTDLEQEVTYNWQRSNMSWDYVPYEDNREIVAGSYEWTDGELVLTEDGGLSRYVFKASADRSQLRHQGRRMFRHELTASPALANGVRLTCEYVVDVVKLDRKSCRYTLSDGKGGASFAGESGAYGLQFVSYGDGLVRIVREAGETDGFRMEHELIDLKSGESLGVRYSGFSADDLMSTGYQPLLCERDGRVFVKAQYVSWCGTAPDANFLFELQGLSSLRNGTVRAVVDGDEIVIAYTDDDGNECVLARELSDKESGNSTPLTRPLVTVTEGDDDGKPLVIGDPTQTVQYHQIAAAYMRIGDEYVDLDKALTSGRMTPAEFEDWLAQAVESGAAIRKERGDAGYTVEFKDADAYHTVSIDRATGEITVGYGKPYLYVSYSTS